MDLSRTSDSDEPFSGGHSFGGGFSFWQDDRKNRHIRNLSQQVLSGVVDPSTQLASTPYVAPPTLKLKIAEFDD